MMMHEILLATSNKGKIKELIELLAPIRCISQQDLQLSEIEETGLSFVENALLKARNASLLSQKPALADDSGLVVASLKGEPGIYSSRYAGEAGNDEANIAKLLKEMEPFSQEERHAYFYCALVLVRHANDPTPIIATGRLDGFITTEACGDQGFGYDPVFYVPEYQCTVAQLPASIKNKISHRAQALNQLKELLHAGVDAP